MLSSEIYSFAIYFDYFFRKAAIIQAAENVGRLKAELEIAEVAFANASRFLKILNKRRVRTLEDAQAGDPVQFHEHEVLKNAVSKFENFDRKVRKLQREVTTAKIDYNARKHEYRSAYLNYSDSDDSN